MLSSFYKFVMTNERRLFLQPNFSHMIYMGDLMYSVQFQMSSTLCKFFLPSDRTQNNLFFR